ncbi:hypothetical protein HanIR_Chr01g0026721 [Helianthus annuus]|nr:hypothetical protein HanIR_Chr01g0026721 [Helianthus annuus]
MSRGVNSGWGQSSLDYLFGSDEPKPTTRKIEVVARAPEEHEPLPKPTTVVHQPEDTNGFLIPIGIHGG